MFPGAGGGGEERGAEGGGGQEGVPPLPGAGQGGPEGAERVAAAHWGGDSRDTHQLHASLTPTPPSGVWKQLILKL